MTVNTFAAAPLFSAASGAAFTAPTVTNDAPLMPSPAPPFVQDAGTDNRFEMTEA